MSSTGFLKTDFELTPGSGDQFAAAAAAARRANLLGLVDGHGMLATSEGHNLALTVAGEQLSAHVAAERGTSMTASVTVDASGLRISAGRVSLSGDAFSLHGPAALGSQVFAVDALAPGNYALIIETWKAPVGVSTYGRAAYPSFFAGVLSGDNKPAAEALYRAGNVDHAETVADASLITGTIESQRAVQRQYRLRLIPDRDLRDFPCTAAHPADRASARYRGDGEVLTAIIPPSATAATVSLDRTFRVAKLALLEIGPQGAVARVNAPHLHATARAQGQNPIRIIPTQQDHQDFVTREVERLDVTDALHSERLVRMERLMDSGTYVAARNQDIARGLVQSVAFSGETHDALGWHDNTTHPQRITFDFAGSVLAIAHLRFGPGGTEGVFDGERAAQFVLNGSITDLGSSTAVSGQRSPTLQLVGELDVRPGDYLSVNVYHDSQTPVISLIDGRLTVRRVR